MATATDSHDIIEPFVHFFKFYFHRLAFTTTCFATASALCVRLLFAWALPRCALSDRETGNGSLLSKRVE
jgi:hypothetical protein